MTRQQAPKIESRSAQDIFDRLAERLDLTPGGVDPLGEALLRVFSRYCEIVIQRLNQVPDKNYGAFLNLIGISQIPPVPARVPLTFCPVKQLPQHTPIVVPATTKAAAAGGNGASEPVVFETERPLNLTSAELRKVIVVDPQEDLYADRSVLLEGGSSAAAFSGDSPIAHEFFIGHKAVFGAGRIAQLRLRFDIKQIRATQPGEQLIEWRMPTDKGAVLVVPSEDTTSQLTRSGQVVFDDLPEWPVHVLFGHESHWLSGHLLKRLNVMPISARATELPHPLPRVDALEISADCKVEQTPVEHALFNNLALDTSKDFYPLGERPRFGDVFYLSCAVFSRRHAAVTLRVELTNPASAGGASPIKPASRTGNPEIRWEAWGGDRWVKLECRDDTQALTEDGTVRFVVPSSALPTSINGLEGSWIRARLVSGHYGEEERIEFLDQGELGPGYRRLPSTLAPPAIQSLAITCSVTIEAQLPEVLITHNNLTLERLAPGKSGSFQPFRSAESPCRSLCFGFQAPHQQVMADRTIDLYCDTGASAQRVSVRDNRGQRLPLLTWQYWNGRSWDDCHVVDGTASLTVSGIVSLRAGKDMSPRRESSFGPSLYWIRVVWESGTYPCPPVLRRVALNTVPAVHALTLDNELLGSSNGTANQVFYSARAPIFNALQLEVREPDLPAEEERVHIGREQGSEAVQIVRDARGRPQEIWIGWHEVYDFISSRPHDRHFVVNRLSGEIRFGDGTRGRIPPVGTNNLRIKAYRTGGGVHGNKPAGSITQLRTAVPFVDAVTNLEPASGGQDRESWNAALERGSCWLRHRGRAVTAEDYEDLAKQASSVVARARCYPLRDLANDPFAEVRRPGVVSLVVVPHGLETSPRPSAELLRHVKQFLDARRSSDADVVVLAPEYVHISVEVELVPDAAVSVPDLAAACEKRLHDFLHPLTGGAHARGWTFGQKPEQSDLYSLLENVRGVEYIRSLRMIAEEEREGLNASGMFMIASGAHRVRLYL